MEKLPEEVLSHVLSHLPVKNLIMNQIVAKRWQYVIFSDRFLHEHLRSFVCNTNEQELLVIQEREHEYVLRSAVTLEQTSNVLDVLAPRKLSAQWQYYQSAQGLISLVQFTGDHINKPVLLWNPSVRRSFLLPAFETCRYLNPALLIHYNVGITYVNSLGTFRFVKLLFYEKMLWRMAHFTLRTLSWSTMDCGGSRIQWPGAVGMTPGISCGEQMHCLLYSSQYRRRDLLSCNVVDGNVTTLGCPEATNDAIGWADDVVLVVIDGGSTLGLLDFVTCLWTLGPNHVPMNQREWVKRYSFSLPFSIAAHIKLNNEIILQQKYKQPIFAIPQGDGVNLIEYTEIARRHQLVCNTTLTIATKADMYTRFMSICDYNQSLALLNVSSAVNKLPSQYIYSNKRVVCE